MSGHEFDALGFDPTPGELSAVQDILTRIIVAGTELQNVSGRLSDALDVTDDWSGDSADDFHDYGDDLPAALSSGAESMTNVGEALSTWAGQLSANQSTCDELNEKAKKLKKDLKAAEHAERGAASAIPSDVTNPHYQSRYQDFLAAVAKTGDLQQQLDKVIEDAHRLEKKHLREANAAGDKIMSKSDGSWQPESDGWTTQGLDALGKISGIVSTASAVVAAGSLVIPGVGEVVAPIAGTVSAASGGVNALTGIAQRAVGSRNAPGNLDIALGLVPGKTVTSGVVGVTRGVVKEGAREGAKKGLKEAAEGFTSAGIGKAAKDIRTIRKLSDEEGSLSAGLRRKSREDLLDKGDKIAKAFGRGDQLDDATKRAIGRVRASHDAFVNTVDTTVKSLEASGVTLTPQQKQELELLKLATNPGRGQAETAVVNIANQETKKHK